MSPESELAGALHEVSNALTVVLGWVGHARLKSLPGPVRDALNVAYAHALRGHHVARKAIGAEVAADDAVRSLRNVAADASLAVEREAAAKGVRVRVRAAHGEAMIGDASSALQVLVNLLLNGIAFSPTGGTVELHWSIQDAEAHFWVSDEGPGVPEALRSSLFSNRQSTRTGGAGIGLSHSYALAAGCGGSLRLNHSERGARFELLWPTCEAPSQLVQRAPVLTPIEGLRVVVLEDDPAVLTMIEFGLQSKGARVFPAENVEQLLRVVGTAESVDVALLDLSPIQQDPQHLLDELRRIHPDLPVLLISGSAVAPDVELPFDGWVQKPFELGELFRAIQRVAGQRGQRLEEDAGAPVSGPQLPASELAAPQSSDSSSPESAEGSAFGTSGLQTDLRS